MLFAYTYRSSDGQRHTAEIEAESRDAAFAKVRTELGIKPIKVVLAEGQDVGGSGSMRKLFAIRFFLFVAIAALAAIAWWWAGARDARPYQVMTPQGPVTLSVAVPLPRQTIPGDRRRIEQAVAQERDPPVFAHAAERWLARYAEPGRQVPASHEPRATSHDFEAALREPIRIASTDFTEVVDLKRIVTGMKREMRAYLAGGGTTEQYLAELEKRQRLEVSYRENAERRLKELLKEQKGDGRRQEGGSPYQVAYAYWLKANAQLQAMGIYPLALPDVLRAYQMGLDIEE